MIKVLQVVGFDQNTVSHTCPDLLIMLINWLSPLVSGVNPGGWRSRLSRFWGVGIGGSWGLHEILL